MKGLIKILTISYGLLIIVSAYAGPIPAKTGNFINMMVTQYHFNKNSLTHLFSSLKPNQTILNKINNPYEKKPWGTYRMHFVNQKRADKGMQYWKKHYQTLKKAEQKYGIPANIIVAIIGIETNYGQYHGKYPVIDALNTLAFYYPRREKFFQNELKEYLLLTREHNIPITDLTGSYAGAIGIPQFMPSTYRHYAVAMDGNKKPDLRNNTDDAIFSIANYLAKAGWQRNQPITEQVSSQQPIAGKWISNNPKPKQACQKLMKNAALTPIKTNQKCALIELDFKNKPQYWLTFNNFSSIMRYNPRIPYAMAVYQLSQKIQQLEKQA